MNIKKIDLALLIGLILTILFSSVTTFAKDYSEIRDSVLRLHILANSDSTEDQALKIMVRDQILLDTCDVFQNGDSKEKLMDSGINLKEIERIAKSVIVKNGFDYDVSAEITKMYFDTRVYNDITVPAGTYDTVRVNLGMSKGKNWWCVMFPPMCIPAASGSEDTTDLEKQIELYGSAPQYKAKLAIVDLAEKIREFFS